MNIKYPKIQIKVNTDGHIRINEERLVDVNNFRMEPREDDELSGKAFFLSNAYNWVIAKDSSDCTCLVPFKKVEN